MPEKTRIHTRITADTERKIAATIPCETHRMQYTIYNALGKEPSAWRNGKLLASISLTIPPEDEDFVKTSWPWRTLDLEALVHSRPNSRFCVEAWDYYVNGVFQYTRYCVVYL